MIYRNFECRRSDDGALLRSSREFGGRETRLGENEDLISMATPPPLRLRSSGKEALRIVGIKKAFLR